MNLQATNVKNKIIVEQFRKLIDQIKFDIDYSSKKSDTITNYYRLKQISNSLSIISKYPKEIKAGEDLKDIKGIGKGTIDRINEILKTGKLSEIKIDFAKKEYLDQIEELQKVIGIGRKTAYDLIINYNIKSIKELKEAYNNDNIKLPDKILTGLKYYGVYKQSIPRKEIDEINDYLKNKVKIVDKDLFHIICGSYRRQKPISNDIDILIVNPKVKTKLQLKSQENYLIKLIKKLKEDKFLLDDLTDKDYEVKYMGFCKFKSNPVRRIDIRYVPYNSYFPALLYFTGSGDFNRKMRLIAQELGYKLNEYGLYKLINNNNNNNKEEKIKITSEEDIFEKLGMEFITPNKR